MRKGYKSSLVILWYVCFLGGCKELYSQCSSGCYNLLATYNPDFSAPFVTIPPGFQSDNVYSSSSSSGITYTIISSRNHGACSATPEFDHTTGNNTGKYMWFDTPGTASVANPSTAWKPYNPNLPPGQQNLIAVTRNTTYVFSCWVRDLARNADCISGGAPIAGLSINGVDVAQVDLGLTTSPCCPQWTYLCAEWNSGADTTAFLRIESRRGPPFTDLGIDDVYFGSQTILNVSLGNDTFICKGQSLTLQNSMPGATYLWSDGSTSSSLAVNTSGIYWLVLSNGSCTGRDSVKVTQLLAPVIALGNDTLLCQGASYTITPSVSGGSPLSFLWEDNTTGITDVAKATGVYWVQAANECGTGIDSVNLTFHTDVSYFSLGQDTVLCKGVSMTLSPLPVPTGNFHWQDNSSGNIFAGASDGLFWLEVNGLCGAYRDSILISSFSLPSFSLGNDTIFCSGALAEICAPDTFVSYSWSNGENLRCTSAASAGDYWVSVTAFNGCSVVSVRLKIAVYPVPSVSIVRQGDTLSSYNAVVYQWYLNGNKIDGAIYAVYVADEPGYYSLEVTDINGCKAMSSPVVISGLDNFYDARDLEIYPNPAANQLFLSAYGFHSEWITVYDMNGRKMREQRFAPEMDISSLCPGIYFLEVKVAETVGRRRFVKEYPISSGQ